MSIPAIDRDIIPHACSEYNDCFGEVHLSREHKDCVERSTWEPAAITRKPLSYYIMTTNEIPIIDLSPFFDPDATQLQRDNVIDDVRRACRVYGFFQLVGHGIPLDLQEKMIDCSKTFFDLPLEEKKKVGREHALGACGRGYEVIGGQRLQADALPDLKEVGHDA